MCKLDDGFILCTCSDKKQKSSAPFTWELFRPRYDEPNVSVIGEAGAPYFSREGLLLVDKLREQLNSRNCFDFDYEPEDGDTLVITQSDNEMEYAFTFRDGWSYDPMPFMGKTMVGMDKGKIR